MKDNFTVKDECSFSLYPEIKEKVILDALIGECITYDLPDEIGDVLVEAWNSRFWTSKGYDGATAIKNKVHPSISNFFHDYFYRCGFASSYKGGIMVDRIYKEMLKMTGYKKSTSNIRYGLIRLLGSYFRVSHRIKGNASKPSINLIDLYNRLKN